MHNDATAEVSAKIHLFCMNRAGLQTLVSASGKFEACARNYLPSQTIGNLPHAGPTVMARSRYTH
jgi:hypothetical protein